MAAKLRVLVALSLGLTALAFNDSLVPNSAVAEDTGSASLRFLSPIRLQAKQIARTSDISLHETDAALAVVQKVFKLRSQGKYKGDACVKRATPDIDANIVIDASVYNMENSWDFRKYDGVKGFCGLMKLFGSFVLNDYQTLNMFPDGKGNVMVVESYKPTLVATGRTAKHTIVDVHRYSVKDGKISACKIFWGDPKALAGLFRSDVNSITHLIKMWGLGKFHGAGCMSMARAMVTDDVVMDARSPMQNTKNRYKMYKGLQGFCEWVANCENFYYTDYKILALKNLGQGKVLVKTSYMPKLLLTKKSPTKPMVDIQEYTMINGKVSACKIYWGAPAALDALFVA